VHFTIGSEELLNLIILISYFFNNKIETVHFAYTLWDVCVFATVPTANSD